jgi:tetratricopeptide (TPR) repeat protein
MLALTLNNYATALMELSEIANPAENTKQAIDAQMRAIKLTPAGHPSLPAFYDNLGHWYRNLFSATSDLRAIQSAVGAQRKSLSLSTTTHPEHSLILASLATSLLTRHELTSGLGDLQEAISMLEDSLRLTPAGHSHISDRQRNLARAYYHLYSVNRDVALMNKAFTLYSLAASSTTTPARSRLNAAMEWVRHARLAKSNSQTFEAMETAMKLVAFVAGMEQSLERRYDNLSELSMLVLASAAFAASQLQRPDKALEWLEQGRGLVWRQLSSLRTPLEDLQAKNPRLAEQLRSLSAELEQVSSASSSRTSAGLAFHGSALQARISSHNQAAQQVRVATEREKVLQTIRTTLPGFENFLQTPPTHEILRHLPKNGPVIVLGAHPTGCYALALLADLDEPMYIPLSFTWDRALELGLVLASNLAKYGVRARGASTAVVPEPTEVEVVNSGSEPQDEVTRAIRRYTRDASSPRNGVSFVLRELWLEVVKPILDSLTLLVCSRSLLASVVFAYENFLENDFKSRSDQNMVVPDRPSHLAPYSCGWHLHR